MSVNRPPNHDPITEPKPKALITQPTSLMVKSKSSLRYNDKKGKGYLESQMGEATKMRGGKRKRYFKVTNLGKEVLKQSKDQRLGLWDAIPDFA